MRPSLIACFSAFVGALLGRRDDGVVQELARHCQIAGSAQGLVEQSEQPLDRPGPGQRLTERPDRVGIGNSIPQAQPEKAHPRQPVAQIKLGALVAETVLGLQDQHLEHQHMVKGRPATLRAIGPRHSALELRAEDLEVDDLGQPFEGITLPRQQGQPFVEVEKAEHPSQPVPPALGAE